MTRPKGARLALVACMTGVVAMTGLAYAAVPLYRAFCQATGFNGAGKRGSAPLATTAGRPLSVRFDTNVRGLPWDFTPEAPAQTIRVGAPAQAFFKVTNHGTTPITGRAVYNVSPEAAGEYLIKTQCFCFSAQTIPAGKTVEFPVIFFVEPGFAKDPSTADVPEIVLSYTFFPAPAEAG